MVNKLSWVLWVALLAILSPLLWEYFNYATSFAHYRWIPFLIGAVVIYAAVLWKKTVKGDAVYINQYLVLFVLAISAASIGAAYLYESTRMAGLIFVSLLWLVAMGMAGRRQLPKFLAIWGLTICIITLPGQLELDLLNKADAYMGQLAGFFLDLIGIDNAINGNTFNIGDNSFKISKVTRDTFSTNLIVVLVLFYAVVRWRSNIYILLLLAMSLPIAIVVNATRLIITGVVMHFKAIELTATWWKWPFDSLSVVLLALAVVCAESLIILILNPINTSQGGSLDTLERLWNRFVDFRISKVVLSSKILFSSKTSTKKKNIGLLVCYCLLFTFSCGIAIFIYNVYSHREKIGDSQTAYMISKNELIHFDEESIIIEGEGWVFDYYDSEVREFDSIWGAQSSIWHCFYKDLRVIFAVDYPFDDWHDVRVCYSNLGWTLRNGSVSQPNVGIDWGASESRMELPSGERGFVLCSHTDAAGGVVQPKPSAQEPLELLMYKLSKSQWTPYLSKSEDKYLNTYYQTQVMVVSAFGLTKEASEEIRRMYGQFRKQVRDRILIDRGRVDE